MADNEDRKNPNIKKLKIDDYRKVYE